MSRKTFLPFSRPPIGDEEINEVVDTLRSSWITTGPKTRRFEEAFAAFIEAEATLALNSCTAGLHTALVTLGISSEDEVITTPLSFAATANVIEHVGARPVFVDVEPDTLNINPAEVAKAVTPRTRAILPVHYAGHPVELAAIRDVASAHELVVLEDAAHAVGARYRGNAIGASGSIAAFSFYATKNLTTAEGGMLAGDPDFLDRARTVSLHGMTKDGWQRYNREGSWYYEVVLPGYKYNMTDIQASIGLCQLEKLPSFQERRREIAAAYTDAFASEGALEVPVERADVLHAWHLYVLRLRPEALPLGRDQFVEELRARNIGTSVHFIPVHMHPFYRDKYGYQPDDFPVTYGNYQRFLSLPLGPELSDQDVADVIEAVLDVVRLAQR
jgi:dTDP-4-amino-4,6-dideoxygalactose transaminase